MRQIERALREAHTDALVLISSQRRSAQFAAWNKLPL